MKMPSGCSRILIAAAIMGCSGMALAAPEPAPSAGQLPPPCPERLAPPPAQPPLSSQNEVMHLALNPPSGHFFVRHAAAVRRDNGGQ